LKRRERQHFYSATLGLPSYVLHHRQVAVRAGANDKSSAFPRYLFPDGQRRVAELLAESLGGLFLAFANFTPINYDIVLIGAAVNLDRAEREFVELHTRTPSTLASGALLRRDGIEGGPALLDVLAAAVRARDLFLVMPSNGQNS